MKYLYLLLLILLAQQARGDCPCMAGTYDVLEQGTGLSASNALLLVQPVSGVWQGTYDYSPIGGCSYSGAWSADITGLTGTLTFVTVTSCSCNGLPCVTAPPAIDITIAANCLSFTEVFGGISLLYTRRVVQTCAATQSTSPSTTPISTTTNPTSTSASGSTGSTGSTPSTPSTSTTTTTTSTNPCPPNCICSINPLAFTNPNVCSACKTGWKNIFSDCTDVSTGCSACKTIFQAKAIVDLVEDVLTTGSCLKFAWAVFPEINALCVPLTATTGELGLPLCDLLGFSAATGGCYFIKKYIPKGFNEAAKEVAKQGVEKLGELTCGTPQLGLCPEGTKFSRRVTVRGEPPASWPSDLHLELTSVNEATGPSQSQIDISQTYNKLQWDVQDSSASGQGYKPCYANNTGVQYQFSDESECLQHQGQCQVSSDLLSAFIQSLTQISESIVFDTPVVTGSTIVQNWTVTPLDLVPDLQVQDPDVAPYTIQYITDLDQNPLSISIINEGEVVMITTFEVFEPQSDFVLNLPSDASTCENADNLKSTSDGAASSWVLSLVFLVGLILLM